jgi:hypothetical protein
MKKKVKPTKAVVLDVQNVVVNVTTTFIPQKEKTHG